MVRPAPSTRRHDSRATDKDLVVAFKSGDTHAYAQIYRDYRPMVESICTRILGNKDDAVEAAQETMLRVFQGLPRFNGRYLLQAWVARIATNVCLDTIRRRGRRPDTSPGSEPLNSERQAEVINVAAVADDPSVIVERLEESRQVRRLLRSMPEHHRAAIEMREFDGRSHEEIADALGMTPPQVKALIHRAKQSFRKTWTGTEGPGMLGFLLPLLALPSKIFRRIFGHGGDAPVPDFGGSIVVAASSPAAAHASLAVGERITAALGAVAVAGAIGVTTVGPSRHVPKAPRAAAPAVVLDSEPTRTEPSAAAAATGPVTAPASAPSSEASVGVQRRPRPTPDSSSPNPEPSGSDEPSAEPSATPSATPSAPTSPTPAPGYTMTFTVAESSDDECSCDARVRSQKRDVGPNGSSKGLTVDASDTGAAFDQEKDAAWTLGLDYNGWIEGDRGSLNVKFSLGVVEGRYSYTAGGMSLVRSLTLSNGSTRYVLQGSYAWSGGPGGVGPARAGTLTATLDIWSDGRTLYNAIFVASPS